MNNRNWHDKSTPVAVSPDTPSGNRLPWGNYQIYRLPGDKTFWRVALYGRIFFVTGIKTNLVDVFSIDDDDRAKNGFMPRAWIQTELCTGAVINGVMVFFK